MREVRAAPMLPEVRSSRCTWTWRSTPLTDDYLVALIRFELAALLANSPTLPKWKRRRNFEQWVDPTDYRVPNSATVNRMAADVGLILGWREPGDSWRRRNLPEPVKPRRDQRRQTKSLSQSESDFPDRDPNQMSLF